MSKEAYKIINKLISADDCHNIDGEWTVVSKKEYFLLIEICRENNFDENQIISIVRRYEQVKTSSLLWKNFLGKKVSIHFVDGEIFFSPKEY